MFIENMVSVIIPTYNRANTIGDSIKSVINQTYENLEIIVVDDGSTDMTIDIVEGFHEPRITCYKLDENHGACYARNYGFAHSNGEFIAFQDSDDIWHLDKIQKQLSFLQDNNYDFVFSRMYRTDGDRGGFIPKEELDMGIDLYELELLKNYVGTVTMFMKRDVMEHLQFDPELRRFQDWDFAIRVAKSYKVGYITEVLVDTFQQPNSISAKIDSYDSFHAIYSKHKKEISEYPIIHDRWMKRLQIMCVNKGNSIRGNNSKKAAKWYWESLRYGFRVKNMIKCLLSALQIKD